MPQFNQNACNRISETVRRVERDDNFVRKGKGSAVPPDGFLAKLTSSFSSGYAWEALHIAEDHSVTTLPAWGNSTDAGARAYHIYGCTTLKSGTIVQMVNDQFDFKLLETLIVPVMTTSTISAGNGLTTSHGTGTCSYGGTSITVDNYYNTSIDSGVMIYVFLNAGGWQTLTEDCA